MEYGCIGFLGICAVYDYRTKTIPIWLFWIFGLLAVGFHLWQGSLVSVSLLWSVGPGLALWIIGKCTEKIGEGDGLMLLVLGLYMGTLDSIRVFFWALMVVAAVSIGLLIGKKGNLRTEIPFAPFLLVSYIVFKAVEIIGI